MCKIVKRKGNILDKHFALENITVGQKKKNTTVLLTINRSPLDRAPRLKAANFPSKINILPHNMELTNCSIQEKERNTKVSKAPRDKVISNCLQWYLPMIASMVTIII